jgi:hypothetical protein
MRWGLVAVSMVLLFPLLGDTAWSQSTRIVRVEEDWELVIGQPDAEVDAPQVACLMSPVGNVEWFHASFEINHQSQPEFTPGGLALQVWEGEVPYRDRSVTNIAVMSQDGETVAWTQSMRLADGQLIFEILNGTSRTWGNFGAPNGLKTAVPTALADLNGYNPAVSVSDSGPIYGGNRVQSLVLKRIRLHTADEHVYQWTVDAHVHVQ